MDTDPETTTPGTGNNTEDALVESSLINAQAAPDNDGVQIVPSPPPRPGVITRSARRATMVMTNKANRRSNGSSLPSLRSALQSLMLS
jgi:hypothetical protein